MQLDKLPQEILLHILGYMDAKFIVEVLSKVSQRFLVLTQDQSTWRTRVSKRWPGQYPAVPANIDWTRACIAREEETSFWSNHSETAQVRSYVNKGTTGSGTVKIIGDLVVVGGARINVWRLSDVMEGSTGPTYYQSVNHKIWSLASSGSDYVVSAGPLRDRISTSVIKFWQLGSHSMQESRNSIKLDRSIVYSMDMKDHTVAAGTEQKVEQTANSIVSSIFSVFLAESDPDG